MKELIAGVDIGGTHISVCLVDLKSGELIESTFTRSSMDPVLDKERIIKDWADPIRQSFDKAGLPVGNIGIAMPGPFDYEKGISLIKDLHKYESLYGENVKILLADQLGIEPSQILMLNDASAFLLGELNGGAGRGFTNAVGITLGTGLGSAGFQNGKIEDGDLWCYPWKEQRAEDQVCARWMINAYEEQTGEKVEGVKSIAFRYETDPVAKNLFRELGINLADILIARYSGQSPDCIVIGGNISRAWDYFIPDLKRRMVENNFPTDIRQATLGEKAALIGAAFLWKE
ncbi:MAG: ROK family protein [Flavitalea sp.]